MNLKLVRSISVYTILGFIPYITSFLLLPIYTRFLSPIDYGIISLATVTESYFILFLVFGVSAAIVRFYNTYASQGREKLFLYNSIFITIITSVIAAICLFFWGDTIFNLVWKGNLSFEQFGFYIFSSCVVQALNQHLMQYFRIKEDLRSVILVTLVPFIFSVAGIFTGVVILNQGATGNIIGKFFGVTLSSLAMYVFIFKKNKTKIVIDPAIIKPVFLFSAPIVLYYFLGSAADSLDRYFLNASYKLSDLGLYNFAKTIISPVEVIILAVWNAVIPVIYTFIHKNPDNKKLLTEYTSKYFDLILLIEFCIIGMALIFAEPIIKVISRPAFYPSAYYIPMLILSTLGRVYYILYTFNIFYNKKTIFLPVINSLSLIISIVVFNYMGNKFGIMGIAASTVILKMTQFLIAYFFERHYDVKYPVAKAFPLLAATLIAVPFFYYPALENIAVQYKIITGIFILGAGFYLYRHALFKQDLKSTYIPT